MPSRHDIVTFHDPPVPAGESPWVAGAAPQTDVEVVEPDPRWPETYVDQESRIRAALGWRALVVDHVGSTAVPGLAAKPIIDIDLIVADPDDESAYVADLAACGFELRVREPWWFGHRVLRHLSPRTNLHVFGYDSPEPVKHRIFRDWLRGTTADRDLYAATKHAAAVASNAAGEHSMQYNARKAEVVQAIYRRAFIACGLVDDREG